jgi:hypothetical protein
VLGLLVELRIERDHAAVGVFELAVHAHELFLPLPHLIERAHELVVLLLHLLVRRGRHAARKLTGEARDIGRAHDRRAARQQLFQYDLGTAPVRRAYVELVHEASGAHDAHAHAGAGPVAAVQDEIQIRDARSVVGNADKEQLRRAFAFERKVDVAAACVAECVAGDLRHCGRHAHLILRLEAEQPRNLPRALPDGDDVLLETQRDRDDARTHDQTAVFRSTTTVASSRPRS